MLAYGLILEANKAMNGYLVGIDYAQPRQYDLIYNIYWEAINLAINKNLVAVEVGVSNDFVKQRFGVEMQSVKMWVKGESRFAKLLLSISSKFWI